MRKMRMKITAGLGSVEEYERFVRAGADEFFSGYVPYEWAKKYGTVMPLNRREVLAYNVQIGSFSEMEILSAMVKEYGRLVHVCKCDGNIFSLCFFHHFKQTPLLWKQQMAELISYIQSVWGDI